VTPLPFRHLADVAGPAIRVIPAHRPGRLRASALPSLERTRPLHAHAAADNTGSIRVLQKCGFAITGRGRIFAQARGKEIDEVALTLV
jgi:hypothetical protein